MAKRKQDPSKIGLSSPNVEGQGTTNRGNGEQTSLICTKKTKTILIKKGTQFNGKSLCKFIIKCT